MLIDLHALTDKLFYALDDAALHVLHYNLLQHLIRTILYLLGLNIHRFRNEMYM